jgi:CheY-like chemotaxis protein
MVRAKGGTEGPLVLVADNEPLLCELLARALPQYGFRVLTAADGAEAVALYRTRRGEVAAVLCDVRMPRLSGPAVLEALRELDSGVRLCFLSASEPFLPEELLALGARAVFEKPFKLDDLAAGLRWVVDAESERRAVPRLSPHGPAACEPSATCYRGPVRRGGALDATVLNLSQAGALLGLRSALDVGEEVTLLLGGPARRPVIRAAVVAWRRPGVGGAHQAGLRFQEPLTRDEVLSLV